MVFNVTVLPWCENTGFQNGYVPIYQHFYIPVWKNEIVQQCQHFLQWEQGESRNCAAMPTLLAIITRWITKLGSNASISCHENKMNYEIVLQCQHFLLKVQGELRNCAAMPAFLEMRTRWITKLCSNSSASCNENKMNYEIVLQCQHFLL